jgi:hypothetical protein
MAQLSAVYDTTDGANSNREDLHDIITNLTPDETPLYSNIGDRSVKAINPEWQVDSLRAPKANAARPEGDEYTFEDVAATDRMKNATQIFSERFRVTQTQETVDKAGKKSEVAYQKVKAGKHIRIDMEVAFLSNQASSFGTTRTLGGLRAYTKTNANMGATGAAGGYNSGTGVIDAATDGTQRAFSKAIMDNLIEGVYTSGGNPKMLMVSPYIKRVFSSFMSDANVAQQRTQTKGASATTIIGAADAYLSDFGLIEVVPNRQMSRLPALARNAFLIDPSMLKKGWLRKIKEDTDIARTGDADPYVVNGEVTLINLNEEGIGVAADLFGVNATT